jgi:hypothetical protein
MPTTARRISHARPHRCLQPGRRGRGVGRGDRAGVGGYSLHEHCARRASDGGCDHGRDYDGAVQSHFERVVDHELSSLEPQPPCFREQRPQDDIHCDGKFVLQRSPFSPWIGTHAPPWRLTVSGTGAVIGASTRYAATLHNLAFDLAGGLYTGRFETGVTATQPTIGTSPICFDFAGAGTLAGPLTGAGTVDTRYCLTGAAAAFSFTN